MNRPCPAMQYNSKVPDFGCAKEQGHSAGHVDKQSGKVWGTPKRPYGMRGSKAARKRKVK